MTVRVQTYSGHRRHERPLRFQFEGAWQTVVQVLCRWRTPETLGFRVLAADGRRYTLEHNLGQDTWKVSPGRPVESNPSSF